MTIPASVTTFRQLVAWLITERHEGSPYRMAKALSVSAGLPFQWRDGTVKRPNEETVAKMCEVYGLDYRAVMEILYPPPPRPRRRRPIPIGGGSAAPLPVENATQHNPDWEGVEGQESKGNQPLNAMRLIRSWARNAWWSSLTWGTMRPVLA